MSNEHEDHGNTPAAWTLVALMTIGFTIGGVGFIIANIPVVIAGAVVCVLAVIVGKVMQMMGMGSKSKVAQS
ncbi:MAG: HGxxPAAW family protein [Actinomycetes bacterium]